MCTISGVISLFEAHSLFVGKLSKTSFEILLCHSNNLSPNDFSFEDTLMMFSDGL